jgi:transcriptional regulator with XRE-family HTH domain
MTPEIEFDRHTDDDAFMTDDDIMRAVGATIRYYRRVNKWTQSQLANRVGLSVSYMSLIERGDRSPSFPVVFRIAQTLRVNWSKFSDRVQYNLQDQPFNAQGGKTQ